MKCQRRRGVCWIGVLAAAALSACGHDRVFGPEREVVGSGRLATESRDVAGFDAVSLSGVGHLVIERNGAESLSVTADVEVLPYLVSEVRGGVLFLGPAPGVSLSTTQPIEYRLDARELESVEASGAGNIEAWEIDTPLLRVAISGVTQLRLAGRADRQQVSLSGSTRYDALDLLSREVRLEASGTSRASLYALELLEGSASGASVVEYRGRPAVRFSVSGTAAVYPLGE